MDEDFAANLLTSPVSQNVPQQQFANDEPTWIYFDEDFWRAFVYSLAPSNFVLVVGENVERLIPPVPLPGDEDFWANPTAPVWILNIVPNAAIWEPDFYAHIVQGQPDEDYWINPVFAVTISETVSQPYLFEQHDPAGSFHGQPDEDFWINPTLPVTVPNLAPAQFAFDQHDPGALHSSVDEDFWSNPTFPVVINNVSPQQFQFEEHEPSGALFGAYPNDGEWLNWVSPVTIPNLRLDQSNFSQGEEAVQLYGAFEYDNYFPLPQPIVGTLSWPAPYTGADAADQPTVFQAAEIESYIVPSFGVQQGTNWQALPLFWDETPIVPQPIWGGSEEYQIPQPMTLIVIPVIPFWPWDFAASEDFKFVVIRGRTYITWIG